MSACGVYPAGGASFIVVLMRTMSDVARKLTSGEIQAIFERSPCIDGTGYRVGSLDHGRQEITEGMGMRPHRRQLHGGPIAGRIDITGDFAINFGTDDVRPAIGESTALARLRRRSRTGLVDIEFVDVQDAFVALGRGTDANTPT
jgi:acyl-coenzyme A thioesterase PaaI-like protein